MGDIKSSYLYNKIKKAKYTTSGLGVDWTVEVDDDDKVIYLLFEESNGSIDWKTNFNFPVKLYKQQENKFLVHGGYGKAYKSCNDIIMRKFILATEEYSDYTPLVCGWSYGGAMAILAAEDYYFRTKDFSFVVTFGAPKVLFGKKTVNYFSECFGFPMYNAYEYAHVNDCVPLMPPFFGYRHINKIKVGSGFSILKLFKPQIYHCLYGDSTIYEKTK